MEDIGLVTQGWRWICSHKHIYSDAGNGVVKLRYGISVFTGNYWPMICGWFFSFCGFLVKLWINWLNCVYRGFQSFRGLDSAALFVIMWSCLLSLTSLLCLAYIFIGLMAAGAVILQLGFTPGIFIVGLFGIFVLWMYANLWIAAILFMAGGYLFSLNHTRLVVFMAVTYALYFVKVQVGWCGVFLSLNFAFLTNDLFNFFVQWCDNVAEKPCEEKEDRTNSVTPDNLSREGDYSIPGGDTNNPHKPSTKATSNSYIDHITNHSTKKTSADISSMSEMNRILNSANHYEALGYSRHKFDIASLRIVYRKKAMLVHPDKNMGVSIASDSFKRLQCAYEVLSDPTKKHDYDEQLRKEDTKVINKGHHTCKEQANSGYRSEQSRRIHCTKCGGVHVWVYTSRSKTKARWCQNCGQYHQARDGDGWVEHKGSSVFERSHKVEIPRAFVCSEGKIFDVSEWAICQGMGCRPNTHRPSFQVNMVGMDLQMKSQRKRHQWGGGMEDKEFETWLKQALASGFFPDSSSSTRSRRKSWTHFIRLNQKNKSQRSA